MIRAILLDLGRVLVPFDFNVGYNAIEQLSGIPGETVRDRIRATGLVPKFETGLIEPEEFVDRLCNEIRIPIEYPRFCEIWSSIFAKETLISDSFVERLHQRYPLVLVSNTNAIHFEMIRREYPIIRHFDHLVLSYEVKAMKPASTIFAAAVERAGCRPEECFFTDDIPEYVEGARNFGIDAVQFEGAEQLQTALEARGVRWE